MTSADKEQAFRYADALRKTIAETRVSIPDVEAPIGVTISGGVSSFPANGKSTADLIHAADQALYGAKRERRNEVVLAQPIARAEKPLAKLPDRERISSCPGIYSPISSDPRKVCYPAFSWSYRSSRAQGLGGPSSLTLETGAEGWC